MSDTEDAESEDEFLLDVEPAMVTRAIMLAAKASTKADTALTLARENNKNITLLEHDIFGNPSHPGDRGFKGEVMDALATQTSTLANQGRQNWAILLAMLALIATMISGFTGIIHR